MADLSASIEQRVATTMANLTAQLDAAELRSDALARECAQSTAAVHQWARDVIAHDDAFSSQCAAAVEELYDACALEQENERIAIQAIEQRVLDEAHCADAVVELADTVRELQKAKDELPGVAREHRIAFEKQQARYRKKDQELKKLAQQVDRRVDTVTDELNRYQELLGMKLDVVGDGCVRFSFICIDEDDINAVYSVTMATGRGQFKLVESDPKFEEIEELGKMLDGTATSLAKFIKEVRKVFKKSAKKG